MPQTRKYPLGSGVASAPGVLFLDPAGADAR